MNPANWKSVVQIRRAWNNFLMRTVDKTNYPADEMIKLVLKVNDLGVKA